jgi:ATP/maltotriose-dependent transcriptional regulator MalT
VSRAATTPTRPREAPALVEAKLGPARPRRGLVTRGRLLAELDRFASVPVTLVAAPVGFGKSVLVETWVERSSDAVAWVSLEAGDSDPARLWTYVATAVDRVRPGLGRGALGVLRSPGALPSAVADELANGVRSYRAPITIVLDDAHVLSDEACWRSLERLVLHLPPEARVVMTTRADPPLRLGRLRGMGALGEIRANELAFTVEEARELLVEREGLALADADVELLVRRTEGWPAGLYLAALWLRGLDDPAAGVQAFHGDHRHVVDYLTGEVLDALDDETRRFLLETSILGVFDAAMCDAVLGRADSAARLRAIERENGFLIALDANRDSYRYHHLFRELLQLELSRTRPDATASLHRSAGASCLERGRIVDALEHAASAGEPALVASILESEHRALLRAGRLSTVVHWCAWLPEKLLVERPAIPLAAALAVGLGGQEAGRRHRLTRIAERSRTELPESWTPYDEVALALVRMAWVDEDLGATVALGRATVDTARTVGEAEVPFLASLAFLLLLAGEPDEARSLAETALGRAEAPARPHGEVVARSTLSLLAAASGDAGAALGLADRALADAGAAGVDQATSGGIARVARAVALAAKGKLAAAEREAVLGERLRRCPDPEAGHIHALLVLAEIRARRGRIDAAAADLGTARTRLAAFVDAGTLPAFATTVERRLARARAAAATIVEEPSDAELNVLRLLSSELSQREIGAHLYLSVNTVKTHMRVLYRKLGVTSRDAAVERATTLGLLDQGDPTG